MSALQNYMTIESILNKIYGLRDMMKNKFNFELFDIEDHEAIEEYITDFQAHLQELSKKVAQEQNEIVDRRRKVLEEYDEKTGIFKKLPGLCKYFVDKQNALEEIGKQTHCAVHDKSIQHIPQATTPHISDQLLQPRPKKFMARRSTKKQRRQRRKKKNRQMMTEDWQHDSQHSLLSSTEEHKRNTVDIVSVHSSDFDSDSEYNVKIYTSDKNKVDYESTDSTDLDDDDDDSDGGDKVFLSDQIHQNNDISDDDSDIAEKEKTKDNQTDVQQLQKEQIDE